MMSETSSYSHRFHAGNVGDVWKHLVWAAVLQHLTSRQDAPLTVFETHAGEGLYKLGATGEWTAGVAKVQRAEEGGEEPVALQRYRDLLAKFPHAIYPGSPLITLELLRPQDRAIFHELAVDASGSLQRRLQAEPRASVHTTDGLLGLTTWAAQAPASAPAVAFIDPPYTAKEDWRTIPAALAEAYHACPTATYVLWYPLKSYTRPNALLDFCAAQKLPALAMDLLTTPLKLQRNRLNGSGMLLINAPMAAVSESLAAAPVLGTACATHGGHYGCRATRVELPAPARTSCPRRA